MTKDFDGLMSKKTNDELTKILLSPEGDYQPEAVESARRELAKRNVPEEQMNMTKERVEKKMAIDKEKAEQPLDAAFKVLAFLFSGTVLSTVFFILYSRILESKGYSKKAGQLMFWSLSGMVFYFVMVALFIFFNSF